MVDQCFYMAILFNVTLQEGERYHHVNLNPKKILKDAIGQLPRTTKNCDIFSLPGLSQPRNYSKALFTWRQGAPANQATQLGGLKT